MPGKLLFSIGYKTATGHADHDGQLGAPLCPAVHSWHHRSCLLAMALACPCRFGCWPRSMAALACGSRPYRFGLVSLPSSSSHGDSVVWPRTRLQALTAQFGPRGLVHRATVGDSGGAVPPWLPRLFW